MPLYAIFPPPPFDIATKKKKKKKKTRSAWSSGSHSSAQAQHFIDEVKPIIDNRCVVLSRLLRRALPVKDVLVEGIDRGASSWLVYQGTRLTASALLPVYVWRCDHDARVAWRRFPPGIEWTYAEFNRKPRCWLVSRLLIQKENHPLPDQAQLLEGFDFSTDRPAVSDHWRVCFNTKVITQLGECLYGMPNLDKTEYATLMSWLENGALMNDHILSTMPNRHWLMFMKAS